MILIDSTSDLVEMIDKYNNNPEYTIQDINELLYLIAKNPNKLYLNLTRDLRTYCTKHDRCVECGKELIQRIHNEKHEYMGSECNEQIITKYCVEHGEM